jgi:hypothetical protein
MMAKADNNSGKGQRRVRLGGGLQRGRTRAGGERQWRQGVAMTAVEAEDGGSGRRRRRTRTTVKADDDNGNGRLS